MKTKDFLLAIMVAAMAFTLSCGLTSELGGDEQPSLSSSGGQIGGNSSSSNAVTSSSSSGGGTSSSSLPSSSSSALPPPSSSSKVPYAPSSESKGDDNSIDITVFDINPDGRYLDIIVRINANHPDSVLDKVEVTVNGAIVNSKPYGGSFDETITLELKDYCDKNPITICYMARLKGESTKVSDCKPHYIIPEFVCFTSSSSSEKPSSSSSIQVTSKAFQAMTFDGQETIRLNTSQGNRGIKLSTGELTESTSDADIYLRVTSEGEFLVAKPGINIIEYFDRTQYGLSGFGIIRNDRVSSPNNTSQFVINPSNSGDSEVYFEYLQYYMVRTLGATEWNSDCFLVYASGQVTMQGGNSYAEVKVWKVID